MKAKALKPLKTISLLRPVALKAACGRVDSLNTGMTIPRNQTLRSAYNQSREPRVWDLSR